jgi:RHS repeat-associated protein
MLATIADAPTESLVADVWNGVASSFVAQGELPAGGMIAFAIPEGEGPEAPVIQPIDRQQVRYGDANRVTLVAMDPNGDPLSWTAELQSIEYYVSHQFGLRPGADPREHRNWLGRDEKWLLGESGWYFVEPDGSLYRWGGGAGLADTWIAKVSSLTHADTSLLYQSQPDQARARIQVQDQSVTIEPEPDFVGSLIATVHVTDGVFVQSATWTVDVLPARSDQVAPSIVQTSINSQVVSVGDPLEIDVTFSEPVVGVRAGDLLLEGVGATRAIQGQPYAIDTRTWRYPITNVNPGWLLVRMASAIQQIHDIAGNPLEVGDWHLTVTIPTPFAEPIHLLALENLTLVSGRVDATTTLIAIDSGAASPTYSASIETIGAHLDRTLHLKSHDPSLSSSNRGEKWIEGESGYYYLLPDGRLYQSGADARTIRDSDRLIAELGAELYASPGKLTDPDRGPPPATWEVRGAELTVNPNDTFVGQLVVEVQAKNDSSMDSKSFVIRVLDSPNDDEAPYVVTKTPNAGASLTGNWVHLDLEFSEPVYGFDSSDLVLSGPGAPFVNVVGPTHLSGNKYRFTVSNLTDGVVRVDLAKDPDAIEDASGNDLVHTAWSFAIAYNNLLFQFPPSEISFTSADTVLSFEGPSRFFKSHHTDNVVSVGGGAVTPAEVRQRGDVAQFDALGYLQFDVEDQPVLTHDWTLFARFRDLKESIQGNTLFAGASDRQLVLHTQTRELGYFDVDGGRGFVGTGYIASALDDQRWHSLAVTRSGVRIDYYVDGLWVGSVEDDTRDRLVYLGGGSNTTFATYLDDFRYFDRSLTDEYGKSIADLHADAELILPFATGASAFLGSLSGIDVDLNDTLELSLENDARGLFALDSDTGLLRITDLNRYQSEPVDSYTITVVAMDRRGSIKKRDFEVLAMQRDAWIHGDDSVLDREHWNHAVATGGISYALGVKGNAFVFDGIDDSLRLRRNAWGNTTNDGVTYSFWMQGLGATDTSLDRDRNLIAYEGAEGLGWSLYLQADGRLGFRIQTSESQVIANDLSYSLGSHWHFVSLLFRDPYNVQVAVDDLAPQEIAYRGSVGSGVNSFVRMGNRTPWAAGFQGKIDEVRFDDEALSRSDLHKRYLDPTPAIGNVLLQPSVPVAPFIDDASMRTISDHYYLVDPNAEYFLSAQIGGIAAPLIASAGIVPLNIDRRPIDWITYANQTYATDTVLTQPLKSGDLQLHLANTSGWYQGPDPNERILEMVLRDSTTGPLPAGIGALQTIVDAYPANGIDGNRLSLRTQYFGPTLPVGTIVRNRSYQTEYQFNLIDGQPIQTFPASVPGSLSGTAFPGVPSSQRFKPGTEYILGVAPKQSEPTWSQFQIESVSTMSVLENQTFGTPLGVAKPLQDGMVMSIWIDPERRIYVSPRGEIFLNRPLDHETQPYYDFQIAAVGVNGQRTVKGLRIEVKDINEPITSLETIRFPTQQFALGTLVGTAKATDPDRHDRITYSLDELLSTPGASNYFSVDGSTGNVIRSGQAQLPAGVYLIGVRAMDLAGHVKSAGFTVVQSAEFPGQPEGSRKQLWASSAGVTEGQEAEIWLMRNDTSDSLQVQYATRAVTATSADDVGQGGDFLASSGILQFEVGENAKRIEVSTLYDLENEDTEVFVIDFNAAGLDSVRSAIRIGNAARPQIHWRETTGFTGVTEAVEGRVLPVMFDVDFENLGPRAFSSELAFRLTTRHWSTDSADYTSVDETVLLPTDRVGRIATQIPITRDLKLEDDESFFVELATAWGHTERHAVQIIEGSKSLPGLKLERVNTPTQPGSRDHWHVDEGSLVRFGIRLDAAWDVPITIAISAMDGNANSFDYIAPNLNVIFERGETWKELSMLVNRDFTYEPNEHFYLAAETTWGFVSEVDVEIVDELLPTVSVNNVTLVGGNAATVRVQLSHPLSYPVTLTYATRQPDSSYGLGLMGTYSGSLVFSPGQVERDIVLPTVPPPLATGGELDPFPAYVDFFVDVEAPWRKETAWGRVLYPGGFSIGGNVDVVDVSRTFDIIDLLEENVTTTMPGFFEGSVMRIDQPENRFELVTTASQGELVLNAEGGFKYRPRPGFLGSDEFSFRTVSPVISPVHRVLLTIVDSSHAISDARMLSGGIPNQMVSSVLANDRIVAFEQMRFGDVQIIPTPSIQAYDSTDYISRPTLESGYHYFGSQTSPHIGRYEAPSEYSGNWSLFYSDRHRLFDQLAGPDNPADVEVFLSELGYTGLKSGRIQLDAPYIYGPSTSVDFSYMAESGYGVQTAYLSIAFEDSNLRPPKAMSGFLEVEQVWRSTSDNRLGNVFEDSLYVFRESEYSAWKDEAGRSMIASPSNPWESVRLYGTPSIQSQLFELDEVPLQGQSLRGGSYQVQPDGTIIYTPPVGFVGRDWLAYVLRPDDGRMGIVSYSQCGDVGSLCSDELIGGVVEVFVGAEPSAIADNQASLNGRTTLSQWSHVPNAPDTYVGSNQGIFVWNDHNAASVDLVIDGLHLLANDFGIHHQTGMSASSLALTPMLVDDWGFQVRLPVGFIGDTNLFYALTDNGRVVSLPTPITLSVHGSAYNYSPPVFTSTPVTSGFNGMQYEYRSHAEEPNGRLMEYSLGNHPDGMTVDSASGVIHWEIPREATGIAFVSVIATDSDGESATQDYSLRISRHNQPPVFRTSPTTDVEVDQVYRYAFDVQDPDGDPLQIRLLEGAGWNIDATMDGRGSLTRSITTSDLTNPPEVVLEAWDGIALPVQQHVKLNVLAARGNQPPVISSTPIIHFENAGSRLRPLGDVRDTNTQSRQLVFNLRQGETATRRVSIRVDQGAPKVDVMLLLDDTTSFELENMLLTDNFRQMIDQLRAANPLTDFGFGVSRFEDLLVDFPDSGFNNQESGTAFTLNQPILDATYPRFQEVLQSALGRSARGSGGADANEAFIEALYQLATGRGIDGNRNATSNDNGVAGSLRSQIAPTNQDVPALRSANGFMFDPTLHANFRVLRVTDQPLLPLDQTVTGVLDDSMAATVFRYEGQANELLSLRTNLGWMDGARSIFNGEEVDSGVRLISVYTPEGNMLRPEVNTGFLKQFRLPRAGSYAVVIDQEPLLGSRQAPGFSNQQSVDFNEAENGATFVTPYTFTLTATSSFAIPSTSFDDAVPIDLDATVAEGAMAINDTRLYRVELPAATLPLLRILEGAVQWEVFDSSGVAIRSSSFPETVITPTQPATINGNSNATTSRYSQQGNGTLPAGSYFLRLRSTATQPEVRFRFMDPSATAQVMTVGTAMQRSFAESWTSAFYQVQGRSGEVLEFQLATQQASAHLFVISPDGRVLEDGRSFMTPETLQRVWLPMDGRYIIGVSLDEQDPLATMQYVLQATLVDKLAVPETNTSVLQLGKSYQSAITDMQSDVYTVSANAGDQLYFDGQQSDARIRVDYLTSDGNVAFSLFNSEMNRMLPRNIVSGQHRLQLEPTDLVADVPSDRIGGGGFRPGALPILIAATDAGSRFAVDLLESGCVNTLVSGVEGTVGSLLTMVGNAVRDAEPATCRPYDASLRFVDGTTNMPDISGLASVQDAIAKLVEIGAMVVGVGTGPVRDPDGLLQTPGALLEEVARLTGSVNASQQYLPNNIPFDSIAPGEPLYISTLGTDMATSIELAIQSALGSVAFDLDVIIRDSSGVASLASPDRINASPSQPGYADISFVGDGGAHGFYLEFVRHNTDVVIGRIPIGINASYRYDVDAFDSDNDILTYSLQGDAHGASIDSKTGEISWLPAEERVYSFTVQVSDGRGGIDTQTWDVDVAAINASNASPMITAVTPQVAEVGRDFEISLEATDPDNDALRFQLLDAPSHPVPSGVTLDSKTGLLRWTPTPLQVGHHNLSALVTDGRGGEDEMTFTVDVKAMTAIVNRKPEFVSNPVTIAVLGERYRYELRGRDPDGDRLEFRLLQGPKGMALDTASQVLAWAPTESDLGSHSIRLLLSDGQGGVVSQNFSLRVTQPNEPPVFVSESEFMIELQQPWSFTPKVYDPNGDLTAFARLESPPGLTMSSGTLFWTPAELGYASVLLEARDGRGGVATQRVTIQVVSELPVPNDAPRVTSRPTGPAYVGQRWDYDLIATDTESDPIQFLLRNAPAGMNIVSTGPGSARISWVPASLSGNYQVEVWASDDPLAQHGSLHSFVLPVTHPNQPPRVRSIPFDAHVGSTWTYSVDAIDPDGDDLQYALEILQPGMSIDADGVLRWTPTLLDAGRFLPGRVSDPIAKVRIEDGHGGVTYDEVYSAVLPSLDDGQHAYVDNNPTGPVYFDQNWTHSLKSIDPNGDSSRIQHRFKHLLRSGQVVPDGGAIQVTLAGMVTVQANSGMGLIVDDPNYAIVIELTDAEGLKRDYTMQMRFRPSRELPAFTNQPTGQLISGEPWSFATQYTHSGTNPPSLSLANSSAGSLNGNVLSVQVPADTPAGEVVPIVLQLMEPAWDGLGEPVVVRQASTLVATDWAIGFPRIDSHPPLAIVLDEDALYEYRLSSTQSNLAYRLLAGPTGMSVDATGLVRWTPSEIGNYPVELEVADAFQQTTRQRFTVSAIRPYQLNEPPEFVSAPPGSAARDAAIAYPVTARDANGDRLEFSIVGPSWLGIDPTTGLLSGVPVMAGDFPVTITAREVKAIDADELESVQSFSLHVLPNAPPKIVSSIPSIASRRFVIGQSAFRYQVVAMDPNAEDTGALRFQLVTPDPGASIDALTGLLTYETNDFAQRGKHTVTVQVSDANGGVDTQTFSVQALTGTDAAPEFVSQLRSSLPEGLLYSLELQANDLDGDDVTFALESIDVQGTLVPPPAGMRLEQGRVVVWTPPKFSHPPAEMIVYVGFKATSDRDGLVTHQQNTVTITQLLRNSPPIIEAMPAPYPSATVGFPYRWQPVASDVDKDVLTWKLEDAPSGMILDPRSGRIEWSPKASDIGVHRIKLTASDPYGGEALRTWNLTVRGINLPPMIVSTPTPYAPLGQMYQYSITAEDPDQPAQETRFELVGGLAGMSIDSNGLLTWAVPTSLAHGTTYDFKVRAVDTRGAATEQAVFLTVYNAAINAPPAIDIGLPSFWIVGDASPKLVHAADPGPTSGALSYALLNAPIGLELDSATRELRWTPTLSQLGIHTVTLVVFDGEFYARETKRILVRTNSTPEIVDIPKQHLIRGQSATWQVRGIDTDRDTLSYGLMTPPGVALPAGVFIDTETGWVRWDSSLGNQAGVYTLIATASDGFGGMATKDFQVQIDADTQPPTVTLTIPHPSVEAHRDVMVSVVAVDDVSVEPRSRGLTLTGYSEDGQNWLPAAIPIELDPQGRGVINTDALSVPGRSSHLGYYRFEATARDTSGNVGYAGEAGYVVLQVTADATPPSIEIRTPSYNQSILEPIDVVGSIDDPHEELAEYWVTLQPNAQNAEAIEVKRVVGSREPKDQILASIDSTLLENGQWTLHVFAKDMAGNIAMSSVPIHLEGNYKPGVLTLSFTDLDLATPDVPIKIQRTYRSSSSDRSLDFGYGWSLDFGIPKIDIAYSDSAMSGSSGYPILLDGTRVNVTLSDGTVEGFTFQPYPKDPNLLGISVSWIPYFVPDPGNVTFLEADSTPVYRIANGESWEYISFSNAESYHPASRSFGGSWKLHLQSGTQINVSARDANTAWIEDRNGNRTTLSPDGIEHWSGRKIAIVRDAGNKNRIVSIADSMSQSILYGYSAIGNLSSVRNRAEQTTTLLYQPAHPTISNFDHLLRSIRDPAGREQLVASFGDDRRLASLKDVENWTTGFAYDLKNRTQSIDEGLNGTTGDSQVIMDRRGNPIRLSDPTNVVQVNRFDRDGRLLEQRQLVGVQDGGGGVQDDLITSYQYDEFGQPTSITDPRGGVSQFIYDKQLHTMTTSIAPSGLTTKYSYDLNGNLLETLLDQGDRTTISYLLRGQIGSVKNRDGLALTTNEYSPQGNLIRTVDSDGQATRFEYDANGRTAAQIIETEKDGLPFEVRTESEFDTSDRVVATRVIHRWLTAQGTWNSEVQWVTTTTFDAATAKVQSQTTPQGLRSLFVYDQRGNLIQLLREVEVRTKTAAGNFEDTKIWTSQWQVYDERGRIVLRTDTVPMNASDVGQSPLVGATKSIYDAAGRTVETHRLKNVVIRTADHLGNGPDLTGFSNYHQLDSRVESQGAIISSTRTEYDSAGRSVRTRDANGLWSETYYGFSGEVLETRSQTMDASGQLIWMVALTAYDDLGRAILSSDTSVQGTLATTGTRTFFDTQGRTTKVERRSGIQLTLLDRFGAVVRDYSQAQGPFQIRIDNQGLYPSGEIQLLNRSINEYNERGQFVRTVTDIGPNHVGVETRFEYDARGRQFRQMGASIESTDSAEKLRAVQETVYDAKGRVSSTWMNIRGRDNGSEVQLDRQFALATSQEYDHLGQSVKTTFADGTSTQTERDRFGRPILETDQRGDKTTSVYDSNGRLIRVSLSPVFDPFDSDSDGVTALDAPTFDYAYDWAGNQTLIQDSNGRVTTMTYDLSGRMLSRTLPGGETETFTYNDHGQQVTHTSFEGIVQQSIYDNGRTDVAESSSSYRVGTGRLVEQRSFAAGAFQQGAGTPSQVWRFEYDTFGRQVKAQRRILSQGVLEIDREEGWIYNSRGQLIQSYNPEGVVNYAYDEVTEQRLRVWTTKAVGLAIENLADAVEDTRYSFDDAGRLRQVSVVEKNDRIENSLSSTTHYEYDLLGRLTLLKQSQGIIERTSYDRLGAVSRIRHYASDAWDGDLGDNPLKLDIVYSSIGGKRTQANDQIWLDADGDPATPDVPQLTRTWWEYDDNGRLIRERVDSFDPSLDRDEVFEMDLFGNRRRRTIDYGSSQETDLAILYLYDANDRLIAEQTDFGRDGSIDKTTASQWSGTQLARRSESVLNVSMLIQSFTYGLDGSQQSVTTEQRDAQGVTTSKTKIEYSYDSQGIRVGSREWEAQVGAPEAWLLRSSTQFLFDDHNLTGYAQAISEVQADAFGQPIKRIVYTFGTDEISQSTYHFVNGSWSNATVERFGHDARGSVRVLYDVQSAIRQIYSYSAYGELWAIHNASAQSIGGSSSAERAEAALTRLLYSGEYTDSRVGLQYLRARWYDSHRFTTLDPHAGNSTSPLSYNKYGYVHGDPINGRDPSGQYLIAIDGTGTKEWLTNSRNPIYLPNGRYLSHVANFAREYNGPIYYDYGPQNESSASDLQQIEEKAFQELIGYRRKNSTNHSEPIDLVGWSRGAYAVLRLAQRLKVDGLPNADGSWSNNVPVRFIGLYDPVDMTFYDGPTLSEGFGSQSWVPGNVKNAVWVHGVESPGGHFRDYDDGSPFWFDWPRMNLSWHGAKTNMHDVPLQATHGAIGGTPGYSPDKLRGYNFRLDRDRSIEADTRVRQIAASVGVPIPVIPATAYGFPERQSDLPPIAPAPSIFSRIRAIFTWSF